MAIEFRYDVTTRNGMGMGSFDTDLNAFIVNCEECNKIVGQGATIADADEDAFCNDAISERESGNTYCAECYERLSDEAMREAMAYLPIYRAEQALRDEQTRQDDYLAQADMAYDAARDRGEI